MRLQDRFNIAFITNHVESEEEVAKIEESLKSLPSIKSSQVYTEGNVDQQIITKNLIKIVVSIYLPIPAPIMLSDLARTYANFWWEE